ncbi:general substrate transporter [Aaosphaeria arxii CBS 175.79]|uniref:General substrate transporter n=1 Tax=Aaosphaeria arxii CBS 175.79 TaxID=1450172 RepID=A0A6A5YAU0_9PLEO|nr:general substrate transporter [Aaosphaeria arxii CBS 175.79]KAF2022137.1 general substrate transporter [Aaosphaeria arxii CBS 175.79]
MKHRGHRRLSSTDIRQVQNVALADAQARAGVSPWTKAMWKLYLCLLIATLNSCINGYDGSLMGAINSYPQYREYFGFNVTEGTPETGIVYAIYTIGNLVGSFFAGPATDWKGRRWGMFIGCLIIMLGTCIQATCFNLGGFMGGRFVLGFGVAITSTAGPAYASEMAHPAYRGVLTGIFNTFWFVGGIPGTFVPFGTSTLTGTQSWRIPVWLQMIFAGIVLFCSPFLPETPRWLIANDRHEEALDTMARFHGEGSRDSPIVQLEYKEMVEDISVTGSDKRWWDYTELFNSRESLYRTMLVFSMAFFGQWSGNGPVSYYYPAMLRGAGIKNNHTRLLYNGMQNVVSFAGAIFGALYTDKWGRRPQLLVSTSILILIFVIIAALVATNSINGPNGKPLVDEHDTPIIKRPNQAKAVIAFIFIFGFVYSAGYTPLQQLYPVECLRYESRAKGMAFYNFWVNIANFYNTFVTGIAFESVGWKYYFLFIFWDAFEFVFIYFFFVETRRRTLEELSDIFKSRRPVKASLSKTRIVVHGGHQGVSEVLDKEEGGARMSI